MLDQFGDYFADSCISKNIIKEENKEIITFGIGQLLFLVFNFILIGIVVWITHEWLIAFVYCLIYIPLIRFVGSYHAKTRLNCSIKTVSIFCVYLFFLTFIPSDTYILISIISILIYVILAWRLTPVVHKNKPLSKGQMKKNRSKVLFLSLVYTLACCFFRN